MPLLHAAASHINVRLVVQARLIFQTVEQLVGFFEIGRSLEIEEGDRSAELFV